MKIYNLFPRLAGPFDAWDAHLERAASMGFDWVFVNPIQKVGRSGSLYSVADYFAINPDFLSPGSKRSPAEQVSSMIKTAEQLGLSMMIDLVINHCAVDSALVREHPEWFLHDGKKVANPFCVEPDGSKTVWYDLAQFDHLGTKDRKGLFEYCVKLLEHLIGLGFKGFRCDAAYQIPNDFWERLISRIRKKHPGSVFIAETLGCTPEQTAATASAGFDALFNSSKWWDFQSQWLLDQYNLTRQVAPSISFPESHDTERLYCECGSNADAMKQRYLFAALFSGGVMIPIGFEFGFCSRLDVVNSRPDHWEAPNLDLTHFITDVNKLKDVYPVFQEDGPIELLEVENSAVLMLHKRQQSGKGEALLILNKDVWNRQHVHVSDLYRHIRTPGPLRDVSLLWPMDYLPTPFDFDLAPGMARILVTES